jgi:hypothetical protein
MISKFRAFWKRSIFGNVSLTCSDHVVHDVPFAFNSNTLAVCPQKQNNDYINGNNVLHFKSCSDEITLFFCRLSAVKV